MVATLKRPPEAASPCACVTMFSAVRALPPPRGSFLTETALFFYISLEFWSSGVPLFATLLLSHEDASKGAR